MRSEAGTLVERAVNAIESLADDVAVWTCADALAFVVGDGRLGRHDAAAIAERLAAVGHRSWTGADLIAMVDAARVDFGPTGRGAAVLSTVGEVAELLPDLDHERRELALDLLRRGGGTADLAIMVVPSSTSSGGPSTPSQEACRSIADSLIAMHLTGGLDSVVASCPSATRRAFNDACIRADELAASQRGTTALAADPLWAEDESSRAWRDARPDDFEAVYRSVVERPSANALLDLLIDRAGERLSGDDLLAEARTGLTRPKDVASALNGLRAAVRATERSAPYRSWPGRPTRYGMHPSVAAGFASARRRLFGAEPVGPEHLAVR